MFQTGETKGAIFNLIIFNIKYSPFHMPYSFATTVRTSPFPSGGGGMERGNHTIINGITILVQ